MPINQEIFESLSEDEQIEAIASNQKYNIKSAKEFGLNVQTRYDIFDDRGHILFADLCIHELDMVVSAFNHMDEQAIYKIKLVLSQMLN
jgi:hypothetical protein